MLYRAHPSSSLGRSRAFLVVLIVASLLVGTGGRSLAQVDTCDCSSQRADVTSWESTVEELGVVNGLFEEWGKRSAEFQQIEESLRSTDSAFQSAKQASERQSALQEAIPALQEGIEMASDPDFNPFRNPYKEYKISVLEVGDGVQWERPAEARSRRRAPLVVRPGATVVNFASLLELAIRALDASMIRLGTLTLESLERSAKRELQEKGDFYRRSEIEYEKLRMDRGELVQNMVEKVAEIDRARDRIRNTGYAADRSGNEAAAQDLATAKAELVRAEQALRDCLANCEDCPDALRITPAGAGDCYPRFVPIVGWVAVPDISIVHSSPAAACEMQRQYYEPEAVALDPFPYQSYWSVYECSWEGGLILPGLAWAVCPNSPAAYLPSDHDFGFADGDNRTDMCVSGYHQLQPWPA